jgi:hypothetical protein
LGPHASTMPLAQSWQACANCAQLYASFLAANGACQSRAPDAALPGSAGLRARRSSLLAYRVVRRGSRLACGSRRWPPRSGSPARPRGRREPAGGWLLPGVGPHRLQHPVPAGLAWSLLLSDEGLAHQGSEAVQDVPPLQPARVGDIGRRVGVEAGGEDPRQLRRMSATSAAAAAAGCSQLSSISSSAVLVRKNSTTLSAVEMPGRARARRAVATACAIASPSPAPASSHSHAPSEKDGS